MMENIKRSYSVRSSKDKVTPVDFKPEQLKKIISEYTKEKALELINNCVVGNFTLSYFIDREIQFHQAFIQSAKELNFWNSVTFGEHCISILKTLQIQPLNSETDTNQKPIEMKPVLKPEAVQIVFDIIKDFFSTEQQNELKQVIKTGNKASEKLLFLSYGNRLTDTFKKLIGHDFITGCQKQDLINWIISNFMFIKHKKATVFIYDTVEKTISRNYYPCQSPLIEIINGQIQKVEQPRTKKYNKH